MSTFTLALQEYLQVWWWGMLRYKPDALRVWGAWRKCYQLLSQLTSHANTHYTLNTAQTSSPGRPVASLEGGGERERADVDVLGVRGSVERRLGRAAVYFGERVLEQLNRGQDLEKTSHKSCQCSQTHSLLNTANSYSLQLIYTSSMTTKKVLDLQLSLRNC